MAALAFELIAEVEAAAKSGPPERRIRILQQVAALVSTAQYTIRFEPPGRSAAKPEATDAAVAIAGAGS
jgi:hypothetical protein